MSPELIQQLLIGGGSVAVAVAVLRTRLDYVEKEIERLNKKIKTLFDDLEKVKGD